MLKPEGRPALRALRTERTARLEVGEGNAMVALAQGQRRVYFEGDLEAGVALSGQVAGRIEAVVPVSEVIASTVREFAATIERLSKVYGAG